MDNNKEFIHIDELFQRLRHTVQEEYRSEDAWSRMKNLLDEEMPVTDPVRGSGRKRYFIPLLALLLGIGGATTGYQLYQYNQQQLSGTPQAAAAYDIVSAAAAPVSYSRDLPGEAAEQYGRKGAVSRTAAGNSANTGTPATVAGKHPGTGSNNKHNSSRTGRQPPAQGGISLAATGGTAGSTAGRGHSVKSNPEQQLPEIFQLPAIAAGPGIWQYHHPVARLLNGSSTSLAMNTLPDENKAGTTPSAEKLERLLQEKVPNALPDTWKQPVVPVAHTATQGSETADRIPAAEQNNVTPETPEIIRTVAKDNATYVQKNDGQWYKEEEEKRKFIHTVRKMDENRQYYIDTQSVEEAIVVKHLPVDASIVTGRTENSLGSSASTSSSNFTDLKVLNDSKVKAYNGEEEGGSFFKKYFLKDDIYKLFNGTNKFEAMINFGGQYAPAATGSYGFHFGVGAIYNLTERLDIGLEARYVRKSFSNFYQEDEQKNYNVSQNGSLYSGTETITRYEYTIRNYNSVEIPLYLSYKIGDRLSVMGGIQYVYAAPIKWQLKTSTMINDNFASVEMPQNTNMLFNQQTDFSARSGFGFMAGIGFDASKRISLDFRVSQNFYGRNNSSNNSINSIYNAPVFGLTLGYFFGKKDKIYYLMQNNQR